MSDKTDIVEHLEGFANDAANPDSPIISRYFGGSMPAVDLTRSDLQRAAAEIRALRSEVAALRDALGNVAAACRGSGPWARDHDADTLRTIGKMIEPVTTARDALSNRGEE